MSVNINNVVISNAMFKSNLGILVQFLHSLDQSLHSEVFLISHLACQFTGTEATKHFGKVHFSLNNYSSLIKAISSTTWTFYNDWKNRLIVESNQSMIDNLLLLE